MLDPVKIGWAGGSCSGDGEAGQSWEESLLVLMGDGSWRWAGGVTTEPFFDGASGVVLY